MMTILIAEDDLASRELLSEMLSSWGYRVIETRNGADALQKIAETKPDLVVCDIRMPVLDGVALVQAVRRDNRLSGLPIIALTGIGDPDQTTIATAGFTTFQGKPINSALLKRNVERLLHTSKNES